MADRKTVAVDLDGVLADFSKGWQGVDVIGDPIPGAVEFTRRLSEFADILIWTTRTNPEIGGGEGVSVLCNRVRDWLDAHGFHYVAIWTGLGKPIAAAFIDDRAIVCAPEPKYKTANRQAEHLLENDFAWALDAAEEQCRHVPPGCSLGGKELGRG